MRYTLVLSPGETAFGLRSRAASWGAGAGNVARVTVMLDLAR